MIWYSIIKIELFTLDENLYQWFSISLNLRYFSIYIWWVDQIKKWKSSFYNNQFHRASKIRISIIRTEKRRFILFEIFMISRLFKIFEEEDLRIFFQIIYILFRNHFLFSLLDSFCIIFRFHNQVFFLHIKSLNRISFHHIWIMEIFDDMSS